MRFLRLGKIPPNERSINFYSMSYDDVSSFNYGIDIDAEIAYGNVKEKDLEIGVSVFDIDEYEKPILSNDELKKSYESRIGLDKGYVKSNIGYIVEGDEVGRGKDGEPLIKNIRIVKEIVF